MKMNMEMLFLFLILLLGLMLCSLLGGSGCRREGMTNSGNRPSASGTSSASSTSGKTNGARPSFDNYNHYSGTSSPLADGSTFYEKGGASAKVATQSDGTQTLEITLPGETTPVQFQQEVVEGYTTYSGPNGEAVRFYGPENSTATVVNADNGQVAIKVETDGVVYYYNSDGVREEADVDQYNGYYGGEATSATGPRGNTVYNVEGPRGNEVYGANGNGYNYYGRPYGQSDVDYYQGPRGGEATSATGLRGNTVYNVEGPRGNEVYGASALPPGIPRSQIPPGDEDLYILKSEVVPPVCPACPVAAACPRQEPCPPCPACARCPEPSFECKKVPNYSAIANEFLPMPVVSDFSQFGM